MKRKTQKLGSLLYGGGTVTIYHDFMDGDTPYRLYMEWYYKDDNHDYPTKHRKLVGKYANLSNCTEAIHNSVLIYERNGWL